MAGSPFDAAVDATRLPLERAAAEAFARKARLQAAAAAALRAGRLRLPGDVRERLARVATLAEQGAEADDAGQARAAEQARAALAPLCEAGAAEALLDRPLTVLPGVGPKRADQLRKRGLVSVLDLLFHLPTRYDDRRERTAIGGLAVGSRATFVGEVLLSDFASFGPRGRRVFQAVVGDETGTVNLKWFRGGDSLKRSITKGARVLVTGDVRRYRFQRELIHPEVDVLAEGDDLDVSSPDDTGGGLVPDYPVPEGVAPRTFRGLVLAAVDAHADLLAGYLPESLVEQEGLPSAAAALVQLHRPDASVDADALREGESPALERLVLEELLLMQLGILLRRARRNEGTASVLRCEPGTLERARGSLPFRLTGAQERVLREIARDLAAPHPMMRLVQGDVGSGKTAVAWLAAVMAAGAGHQTALMAPTELLAEQHHRTLAALGSSEWLSLDLLTASRSRADAEAIRARLASGELDLVVGTHALVQGDVAFSKLGLVIVDEQHRFGVLQRAALTAKGPKGRVPHTLVMTATPIPRTLALTQYGELDVSVIDELPPGRTPVRTLLVKANEGQQVMDELRATLDRGERVYVVYPLVEESEKIDLRSASESAEAIQRAFSDVRVDLVHGRLDAAERAEAMARFERGETRILVATTVIEVGVDVPEATLMVIEHAERFGLAQLHQLRGRVGRGAAPGTCLLVSRGGGEDAHARLQAMLKTTDGFRIADADLRIRGPGEFLGTRQSGHVPLLRIADLARDGALLELARQAAEATLAQDPGLRENPGLARAVERRWGERLRLAGVG